MRAGKICDLLRGDCGHPNWVPILAMGGMKLASLQGGSPPCLLNIGEGGPMSHGCLTTNIEPAHHNNISCTNQIETHREEQEVNAYIDSYHKSSVTIMLTRWQLCSRDCPSDGDHNDNVFSSSLTSAERAHSTTRSVRYKLDSAPLVVGIQNCLCTR